MAISIVVVLMVLAVWVFGLNLFSRWKHRHLPGPKPNFLLGNLPQLGEPGSLHLTLQKWAQQFGPIFCFYFGRKPNVVISDPELIKAAGIKHFVAFHDRSIFLRVGSKQEVAFEEKGMVLARGKYWAGLRAACEPLFHQSALASYAPTMNQGIDRLVTALEATCESGAGLNINEALAGMSMDIIGGTAFGVDFDAQRGGEKAEIVWNAEAILAPFDPFGMLITTLGFIVPQLERVATWLGVRLGAPGLNRGLAAKAFVWGAAQQLLENSRASDSIGGSGLDSTGGASEGNGPGPAGVKGGIGGPPGTAQLEGAGVTARPASQEVQQLGFLPAQQRQFERARAMYASAIPPASSLVHRLRRAVNRETGEPLSDMEICAQCYTFLLAGYETTSLALSYTLYELAQHPHMQRRIREEAQAALGPHAERGGGLGQGYLSRLPFTEAVFMEALRKYPPVASLIVLARECREDSQLGGYAIPAGSRVMFDIWTLHRDPQLYPEPETFRPERFLADSVEARTRHPAAYIPFGIGPHKCIGYKFAMMESVLALARLVQRFDFELDPGRHQGPLQLESFATLQPKGGIWLHVRPAAAGAGAGP